MTDLERTTMLLDAAATAAARIIAILDEVPDAFSASDKEDIQGVLMDSAKEAANAVFGIVGQDLANQFGAELALDGSAYREYLKGHIS